MPRTTPSILPRLARLITNVGENIRMARLRRAHSLETVAERAGITRKTLYRVERGDPAVALGIYARVLQALRLENDLAAIAADDVLGRKLQDLNLEPKTRAPRRKDAADNPHQEAPALAIPAQSPQVKPGSRKSTKNPPRKDRT
ncbi:helix-turn-helix transcriptional regulator [uncultured Paludibaculum sp.]|uniref:helix-turn-helix domain-containing protein n=1 Tax=uncultured Paludibaculum sp. TaxID=1765020 RepID=UPI002AABCC38|nr:helix-turn-helix transcriptional regulator [uncultured Paludibaculum sp.]